MSIGFQTSNSHSRILANINRASTASDVSSQRIGSGSQINSTKDNAAGLSIVTRLSSDLYGIKQARRNVSDANSFLQTGDGALRSISSNLQRVRELTLQAGNGILNADDRQGIQSEIDSLKEEIFNVSNHTQFNGVSVLNTGSQTNFQVGNEASHTVSTAAASITRQLEEFGLAEINVSSSETASESLATLDSALNAVSSTRSELGAVANRLDSIGANLENQHINNSAASSRIQDTDIALETAKLINADIMRAAGIALLAHAKGQADSVLRLLG